MNRNMHSPDTSDTASFEKESTLKDDGRYIVFYSFEKEEERREPKEDVSK